MAIMPKGKRTRRKFTDEFKAGAVRLVLDEGKTVAQVARDLDLTESALGKWVKHSERPGEEADPDEARQVAAAARRAEDHEAVGERDEGCQGGARQAWGSHADGGSSRSDAPADGAR